MSIPKNVLHNSYSSMKKKQKDSDDFWRRKLTLKVKFRHFLTPPHYTNSQNSMISFDYCWFLAKNLLDFVFLSWKLHNQYCHNPHSCPFVVTTTSEIFFFKNPKLLGLGRQIGLKFFVGSASILVVRVPCPCFPLFNFIST